MKRIFCISLVLIAFGMNTYGINEDVVTWEQILKDVNSDEQRVAVVLKIMEFRDREFTPVLVNALDRIVSTQKDAGSATDQYNRNILAKLLVQELGNLKSIEASELVFRIYDESTDPVLKSEAARALGKMRATEYAERLSADLTSINLAPVPSISKNQEIIALALVQSLEVMRSPLGYEPVFLAAQGWYSTLSRVRDTAKAALLTMLDDPSESLNAIMTTNPSVDIKVTALETLLNSKAPAEKKIDGSVLALKIGVERTSTDVASRTSISRLRVTSMVALAGLGDKSPDTVPLLTEVIKMDKKNDATLDETLKAYVALGVNGSDEAAKYLAAKLREYNGREKSKANTVRDKSLIRQIIASMVLTQNPIVKTPLVQGQFIDYDANILNLITDALTKFPK